MFHHHLCTTCMAMSDCYCDDEHLYRSCATCQRRLDGEKALAHLQSQLSIWDRAFASGEEVAMATLEESEIEGEDTVRVNKRMLREALEYVGRLKSRSE